MTDALDEARTLIRSGAIASLSLDLFDTVLFRRTTCPEGVFERAFHHVATEYPVRLCCEAFVQHRVLAEAKARRRKLRSEGASETSIEEIYGEFPARLVGLGADAPPLLAVAEFRAELDLCFANPEITELAAEARGRGIRIGFISDTFWRRPQLMCLLREKWPEAMPDFLYASSEHGIGKAAGLLGRYLAEEGLDPRRTLHIGDNHAADVAAALDLGMAALHYAQAPRVLAAAFPREDMVAKLLRSDGAEVGTRVDDGMRMARRLTARRIGAGDEAALVGGAFLGPVLAGFERFLERRVAALRAAGRNPVLLFLARDGFLLKRVWDHTGMAGVEAHYAEINRRVCLVGCADEVAPVQRFFEDVPMVNRGAVADYLRARMPRVEAFFLRLGDRAVSGSTFAEVLPKLVDSAELAVVARETRRQLLEYLRALVSAFDACTDLMLVDLGYHGTIQRSLRGILDREGITIRLHGVYLLAAGDAFASLAEGDTVEGWLDDATLTPLALKHVLRNVSVLEQLCSAPAGSVSHYEGGEVRRGEDRRPQVQRALIAAVQRGCLGFVNRLPALAAQIGRDPLADLEAARGWSAAILARFLLLPGSEEIGLLGGLQQEINLGSRVAVELVDQESMDRLLGALPLAKACSAGEPPMWLSATLAARSPALGHAYCLNGFGLLGGDAFEDVKVGEAEVAIISGEAGVRLRVACLRTAEGDIRLHIPVQRRHTGSLVALPLAPIAEQGVVRAVLVRRGGAPREVLRSTAIEALPLAKVTGLRAEIEGHLFRAVAPDAYLLLPVPRSDAPLTILTLLIGPLAPVHSGARADRPAAEGASSSATTGTSSVTSGAGAGSSGDCNGSLATVAR